MTMVPKFTGDLAELPTSAYGHRSLTWWGIIAFFLIEGGAFAMAIAAYFYLAGAEQNWPPDPWAAPDLLAGTLFTVIIVLSEFLNTKIKHAAEKKELKTLRLLMPAMLGIGLILLVLRGFEFPSLNIWWSDNAYGSVIWALLLLHAVHFLTDFVDTAVLTALLFTEHAGENRKLVDVAENAMYWRFVWLSWLPIYLMIYWIPRWVS